MTTEPEPTETPEVETAPPTAEQPGVAEEASAVAARPVRPIYASPVARVAGLVIAAALIFGGGFATGHWAADRHENDHRRPDFSARAQRFMQGLSGQQRGGGQSRNAPGMGQAPNLQQILPFLEQLLNNRNGGSGSSRAVPNSSSDEVQRQIQQLQRQVKELQDQLKNAPTPTPR
jgi:hypothetical protein